MGELEVLVINDRRLAPTETVAALRCGGYLVARVDDIGAASRVLHDMKFTAIVIDLPVHIAVQAVCELAVHYPEIPLLLVTRAPSLVTNVCSRAVTLSPTRVGDELIEAMDRLLAGRQSAYREATVAP